MAKISSPNMPSGMSHQSQHGTKMPERMPATMSHPMPGMMKQGSGRKSGSR